MQMDGKRVVVVDDDPIFLEFVASLLTHEGGMRVLQVTESDDVFKVLRSDPDIVCIVLDYDLGADTGLTLGKAIKDCFPDAPPIVMLTAQGSERTAVKAFRIGFSDYVSKRNLDKAELIKAIRSAIARREGDMARLAETAKLRGNARFDNLTGLHAASYVEARLSELRFRRSAEGFSLFVVRPKQLDQIREALGYSIADRLLRNFANLLKEATSEAALCGHIGTEQFVCIYEGRTSPELIRDTCDRLARAVQLAEEHNRVQLRLDALIGAAVFPLDGDTANKVLDAARFAMDQADTLDLNYGSTVFPFDGASSQRTSAAPAMSSLHEMRKEPRKKVLKKGKIIVGALNSVIDCTVRNLSESGAHLRADSYFPVPERFKLQIGGMGQPREVEKRWQAGSDFGVEFRE